MLMFMLMLMPRLMLMPSVDDGVLRRLQVLGVATFTKSQVSKAVKNCSNVQSRSGAVRALQCPIHRSKDLQSPSSYLCRSRCNRQMRCRERQRMRRMLLPRKRACAGETCQAVKNGHPSSCCCFGRSQNALSHGETVSFIDVYFIPHAHTHNRYSLSADGRRLFNNTLFTPEEAAEELNEATETLELCNQMAR